MNVLAAVGRFIYDFTLEYGAFGLAVGAFLESLGIPPAAAVIDLTAGILIISGRTSFIEAVIVSDLGMVAGSLASYYLGRAGAKIVERRDRAKPEADARRSKARQWLEGYGDKAIFFGQLFGPARTWISYPAGAMGMDVKKFAFYTAAGGAVYCTIIVTISLYFTDLIRRHLETIGNFFSSYGSLIPALLAALIILVVAWRRRARRFAV